MSRLYKIVRFLIKRRLYFAVRNSWLVWFYILNREGRALYRKNPSKLDAPGERILKELQKSGIALTSLEELFPSQSLLPGLVSCAIPLREKAEIKTRKKFLKNLFERVPVLDLKNPFVQFALDQKILGIISHYYKFSPKFRGYTLNLTTPMGEGEPPIDSQRWHRDPEDKIVLKVFIYLTDVDENSGPFIYIKGSHHLGKYRKLFPTAPPAGSYPPAGEVEKKVKNEDIKINAGRAGTVIFCETSGLHKGGYATKKERLMFTAIYASRAATSPRIYKLPDNFDTAYENYV